MMKSFFKKLAFVMALAMVVSAMAPAATAKAADAGLVKQESTTWEIIAKDELTEGESQDYKFAGAPKEWRSLGLKWTSSDPTVATVDPVTGLVKAEKAGTTTIKVAGGTYEASLVLTVNAKPATVKVDQVSDTVAKLTFADPKTDISGLTFYYYVGETKIYYPCQVTSYKDGVATITSYVPFIDGWKYGFEVAGLKPEFEAVIGEVAAIVPSFKSEDQAYKAFSGKETKISYTLLNEKGIDITNAVGGTVEFSFKTESETGAFWFVDQTKGTVHFSEEGATASVVLKYLTGKYDETTYEPIVGAMNQIDITSEKVPAFALDMSKVPVANIEVGTVATDWTKVNNIIALEDDLKASHTLVVKFASNKGEVTTKDPKGYGTFSFKSTNEAKLYVAADGTIMANAVGETPVIVYFTPANTTTKTVAGVVMVDVWAKRAVSSMVPNTNSVTVSTVAPYNTAEITFTLKDQLKADIASAITVKQITKAPMYDAENKTEGADVDVDVAGNKLTITGADMNIPKNAKSYTYTFEAKCGGKTVNFYVTVRRPDATISGYVVEFDNVTDVKTTANANIYATAQLYKMSNGVKSGVVTMTNRPDKAEKAIAGDYYYTVSKGSTALGITGTTDKITIQLTNIKENTTVASGTALDLVDKNMDGKGGAGSYTVIVYQAVGEETGKAASGFRQIASNTLVVGDTQDKMGTTATKVRNSVVASTAEEAVMNGFKFTYGNKTFEVTDTENKYNTNGVVVVANANKIDANKDGLLDAGSICFIKSVDLYVPVGGGAYIKYTVTVNDYVEIQ